MRALGNRAADTPGITLGTGGFRTAWIWMAIQWCVWTGVLSGQSAERIAFDAASRDFETGLWERATVGFNEFGIRFPKSPLKTEAALRLLYSQGEFAAGRDDAAGAWESFAAFQRQFPDVPRAGLAAVREAEVRMKSGDPAGAVEVLLKPQGSFVRKAVQGKIAAVAFRGLMVRAEAQTALKDLAAAEASLQEAAAFAGSPVEEYARLSRQLRILENTGRLEVAVAAARRLRDQAARESSLAAYRPEAVAWEGRLLLKQGASDAAAAAFEANTVPGTPPEYFREATLRLAEIHLARSDWIRARERLEAFASALPADPEVNRVRLLLGQTFFRQFVAARSGTKRTEATGLLASSAAQFQLGLSNAPSTELVGPLLLGRAWALWETGSSANAPDPVRDAETNFLAAAAMLPRGGTQALARFKAGDCLLYRGDAAGALVQYSQVLEGYLEFSDVQRELGELAAEQAVRAAVLSTNRAAADRGMSRLLAVWPDGRPAKRGGLLFSQYLSKAGDREGARRLLLDFAARFPESSDRADFQLALVASDLRAQLWSNAVIRLDAVIAVNTNRAVVERAEFERAWARAMGTVGTNAVEGLAVVASRYPTNAMTANAHLWIASQYFNQREYIRSEQACLRLITNGFWRGQEPWFRAVFWAAESARKRQSYESALQYLSDLLNDKLTPEALLPAGYFALGELRLGQRSTDPARPLDNFDRALQAFTKAASFDKAPQRAPALGRMADCHLQLATQFRADSPAESAKRAAELTLAAGLYQQVLGDPGADLAARCQAAMGLGTVREKLAALAASPAQRTALLATAADAYLDIAHGGLRRQGETLLPAWLGDAGREAGRLLEDLGRFRESIALYTELAGELPAERDLWLERCTAARRRAEVTASSVPSP